MHYKILFIRVRIKAMCALIPTVGIKLQQTQFILKRLQQFNSFRIIIIKRLIFGVFLLHNYLIVTFSQTIRREFLETVLNVEIAAVSIGNNEIPHDDFVLSQKVLLSNNNLHLANI